MRAANIISIRGLGLAALALLLLLAAPSLGRAAEEAADGPGTRFRKCRAEAWADYNSCLVTSYNEAEKKLCYFYFDADNVGCDIAFLSDMTVGWIFK